VKSRTAPTPQQKDAPAADQRGRRRSQSGNFDAERACCGKHSAVVARQLDLPAPSPKKIDRCQVQGVQRPQGMGKGSRARAKTLSLSSTRFTRRSRALARSPCEAANS
jgi:hypothetical protein